MKPATQPEQDQPQKPAFIDLTQIFSYEGGGHSSQKLSINANAIDAIAGPNPIAGGAGEVDVAGEAYQIKETMDEVKKKIAAASEQSQQSKPAFIDLTQVFRYESGRPDTRQLSLNTNAIDAIAVGEIHAAGKSYQIEESINEVKKKIAAAPAL